MRVIINTRDTDKDFYISPDKSTVSFNIPLQKLQFEKVKVISAEIPYSFYQIHSKNNNVKVNDKYFNLPLGNYSINTLLNYFKTNVNEILNTDIWGEITYDKIQSKFEIKKNELSTDIIHFDFTEKSSLLFGFTKGFYLGPPQTPNPPYIDNSKYTYHKIFNPFDTYISGSSNNNTFKVMRFGSSTGETLTIVEPDNYIPSALAEVIQNLLNMLMPNHFKIYVNEFLAIDDIEEPTKKFNFHIEFLKNSTTSTITYDIKIEFNTHIKNLFNINEDLIFRNPPLRPAEPIPTVQYIKADHMPQLNSINNIFIQCNFIDRGIIINNKFSKFLCRIPLKNFSPNEMIVYEYNDEAYDITGNISNIELSLCDHYGNPIYMNGCDWFIELKFL